VAEGGPAALVPAKPGPRQGHKLTDEVLEHLEGLRAAEPTLRGAEFAAAVAERFGVRVHPRSANVLWSAGGPPGARKVAKNTADGQAVAESAALVAGYEQLRERALGGRPDRWRLGHGVLAGRAMVAWIAAWTTLPGAADRHGAATASSQQRARRPCPYPPRPRPRPSRAQEEVRIRRPAARCCLPPRPRLSRFRQR
jgi:hypothetical protein